MVAVVCGLAAGLFIALPGTYLRQSGLLAVNVGAVWRNFCGLSSFAKVEAVSHAIAFATGVMFALVDIYLFALNPIPIAVRRQR